MWTSDPITEGSEQPRTFGRGYITELTADEFVKLGARPKEEPMAVEETAQPKAEQTQEQPVQTQTATEADVLTEEPTTKEIRLLDPRTMSDVEKEHRGVMLRNAPTVDVEKEIITSTPELSARKAAEKWWDENVGEPALYNTEVGEVGEVEINRNSVESSLAHRYSQKKLDAITSLVEGFENAVYLGTMPDSRERGVVDHYFAYPIIYGGELNYVFCRAMQDANKNRLYVHEVFVSDKIKKGDTLQTAASKPHGGIALYRDILANVLETSVDKVSKNSEMNQGNGVKESETQVDSDGQHYDGEVTVAGTTDKDGITTFQFSQYRRSGKDGKVKRVSLGGIEAKSEDFILDPEDGGFDEFLSTTTSKIRVKNIRTNGERYFADIAVIGEGHYEGVEMKPESAQRLIREAETTNPNAMPMREVKYSDGEVGREPDFAQVTPERAVRYLDEESGMENTDVDKFVANMIAKSAKAVEEHSQKRPEMGEDEMPGRFSQRLNEWKRQGEELQTQKAYWDAVNAERERKAQEHTEVETDNQGNPLNADG